MRICERFTVSSAGPSVSICIPTYNYCQYLPDALDSALTQEFTDLEIVVVDNCSNDGTPELVESYGRKDSRIVFHRNSRNLGMAANFNRSVELARGKYVKFLCADDVLEKDCVRKMVDVLDSQPDVTLVACRRSVFDKNKRKIRTMGYSNKPFLRSGQQVTRDCYFKGNLIGEPSAVLFRRADFVTGFDQEYHQVLDLELWFRILENGRFVFLAETLCGIRQHESSGTANNLRAGKVAADKVRLFENYAYKPYLRGSWTERMIWDLRMMYGGYRAAVAGVAAGGLDRATKALYYPILFGKIVIPIAVALAAHRSK